MPSKTIHITLAQRCWRSRRWFQFKLRTLLVALTLVSLGLGFLVRERANSVRQYDAVHDLIQVATIASSGESRPPWLKIILGDNGDALDIHHVGLYDQNLVGGPSAYHGYCSFGYFQRGEKTRVPAGTLNVLGEFPALQIVSLTNADISDAEIAPMAKLKNLEVLYVSGTNLTDQGLAHLIKNGALDNLKSLSLADTPITDASLGQLSRLSQLQELDLSGTAITDRGIRHLVSLASLNCLDVSDTEISDNAVESIARFPAISTLNLTRTKIKGEEFARLASCSQLEVLLLDEAPLSPLGIANLRHVSKLQTLQLGGRLLPMTIWPNCRHSQP